MIYRYADIELCLYHDESIRKGEGKSERREGSIRRSKGMMINPSFVRHGEEPLRFLPLISRINTATEFTPACLIDTVS